VPLSNFVPRGLGFVHHSIAILYHEVPNPNLTIRNFLIAVRGSRARCSAELFAPGEAVWLRAGALQVDPHVVDTVGEGDSFVGAFAAALARDSSLVDCMKRGVAAGSLACTVHGAQVCVNPSQACVNPSSLVDCMKRGVAAGSLACTVHGAQVCVNPSQACVNPSSVQVRSARVPQKLTGRGHACAAPLAWRRW
jgi:hypothetical protein